MRISLDAAKFADTKSIERLIVMTADTDCVPALKSAPIAGLQTVLVHRPGLKSVPELTWHSDDIREGEWPT